ncbi:MAG: hypothetical protein HPY76_11595 [Anaerolineae bacterium]|nr:hypothetical protein [Anaerolineae bacterium]
MVADPNTPLYCYNHPNRETMLRCNNCERPICLSCAVKVPTGYRCKDCVRGQQKVFETTTWVDYPVAIVIAGVLSYLGSFLAGILGFLTIFVAPLAGILIAEAVRAATRRRRSLQLYRLTAIATALGALPNLIFLLIGMWQVGGIGNGLIGIIWYAVYAVLVTSTVFSRLSGINIKR